MNLMIVESPTKAKTISKYLDKSFAIVPSVGHIRDLPKSNKKAVDIAAGFVPHYEITKGKEKVIQEIKSKSAKADKVYLATDPDREGEAIAWHIKEACDIKDPKRVVFHEITEEAIKEALTHPRDIDISLKIAQEARRVLDRLVGYDLSGLIWKKVRYGLSAGRVQSPALRIIMEREREIRAFKPEEYWVITGDFETERKIKIQLTCDEQPKNKERLEFILNTAKNGVWRAVEVKETKTKRSPKPPYITSTLQQSASSRLGFSPAFTMSLAQKLYELGAITYMRTDSVNINRNALSEIHKTITSKYGKEYLEPRVYSTKSKLAQEAHEAIRPTKIRVESAGSSVEQKKLYSLIWERALSSQMSDAKIIRTKISANINNGIDFPNFSTTGSVIVFDGWLKVDTRARGEDIELPQIILNENLELKQINNERKETEPPKRYTEAGLVKELEKRGIGRPSTYATIIKTIVDRGYVLKVNKALHPTDTGDVVSTFLEKNFQKYISDSFTAEMEDKLDNIASGKAEYVKTLEKFYTPFHKEIQAKAKTTEKLTILGPAEPEFKCPVCGKDMVVKLAKNGKFLSCANFPKCTGARRIDGRELEGPKETGETCPECGGKLVEREGKFGKFISCSNYPKCKYIKNSPEEEAKMKTGVKCPKCGTGEMVERRGKFGPFYSCSNYPKCANAIKARPTGALCNMCGSLMMEGTKTIPERCSNKGCPMHNPHKLE
ncbi:MAG: type I DNA topoisomerase [Candidatus Colwellbacteria bacterium]|nr:type I DNA topoisomerase [Candidatus Colwellbacteria bacterium]